MLYFREAYLNLLENKRSIIVILIFIILSFSGIAVTDSLIFSTSKKAEKELSLSGNNIITVEFNAKISEKKIDSIFRDRHYVISKSKKMPFYTGTSPFSNEMKMVLGTDKIKIYSYGVEKLSFFDNNMILITEDERGSNERTFFLNGLPFNVSGVIKNKKTEFLDSLGLSAFSNKFNYIIPIKTMFRLTLDDTIDSVDIVVNRDINDADINQIKNKLRGGNIYDFSIRSILDAKKSVANVINKFSLLTNTVYLLMTVMMLVIIVIVCRRAFQSRGTEFALKVIHGINKKIIIRIVIIEIILIVLIGAVVSVILTISLMHLLSLYIGIELFFRPVMIIAAFSFFVFVIYSVGVHSGMYFFKQNPIDLIKSRKQ